MIIIIDLVTSIQHTDQNICNQSNLLFCSVQCEFPPPSRGGHHTTPISSLHDYTERSKFTNSV